MRCRVACFPPPGPGNPAPGPGPGPCGRKSRPKAPNADPRFFGGARGDRFVANQRVSGRLRILCGGKGPSESQLSVCPMPSPKPLKSALPPGPPGGSSILICRFCVCDVGCTVPLEQHLCQVRGLLSSGIGQKSNRQTGLIAIWPKWIRNRRKVIQTHFTNITQLDLWALRAPLHLCPAPCHFLPNVGQSGWPV